MNEEFHDWSTDLMAAEESLKEMNKAFLNREYGRIPMLAEEVSSAVMLAKMWAYKANAQQAQQQRT